MYSSPPHSLRDKHAALLDAGYKALRIGDIDQAEFVFRHALQLDVRSAAAWRGLAQTQSGTRHAICLRWATLAERVEQRTAPPPVHARRRGPTRRLQRLVLTAVLSILGSLTLFVVGSDIAYRGRILPNVSIGAVSVGNQPYARVVATLEQHQQQVARREVLLRVEDRTWRVPMSALVDEQPVRIAQLAYGYGHEPSLWERTIRRTQAWFGRTYQIVQPQIRTNALQQVVAAIGKQVAQPRRDAQLLSTTDGWSVVPEQTGQTLDLAAAAIQLTQLISERDWDQQATPLTITFTLTRSAPQRTAAQLEPLRARMQQLRTQPLELMSGERRWTLDRSMLMEVFTMDAGLELRPGAPLIEQQLRPIAADIAAAPQPSQLVREGDRVRSIVAGRPGTELDTATALQRIQEAVASGAPSVELPVRQVAPPPGEAEQLGLIAELGRGESQFLTYTSPARDTNVQVGGQDIDGVLIAPGEVFSFTQTVGDITWEKGYRVGEAIEAGVVVPSLGGGICQVSTTTFRAAFWSGLEIVERNYHSWRLPWYEIDAPPGLDATIALGGPDLKFRNNTSRYILIKVETDLIRKRQTVIIYGTPDGRKVEMQPVNNGNIGIERRVIRNTDVLADDTFMSYYSQ